MRLKIAVATLLLCSIAYCKEPKHYQTGTLLQMDSVACGVDEKDAKSLAGEMLGTDSGHKKSRELLCQEYLLQSEHVIYRIRPRDDKHPVLLPVGERAQFRIQKDKMLLQVEDLDEKEREYNVVSMTPRDSGKSTDAASSK
jgi:D-serine deaminase-like pyridoxal phosphate-dependent protein